MKPIAFIFLTFFALTAYSQDTSPATVSTPSSMPADNSHNLSSSSALVNQISYAEGYTFFYEKFFPPFKNAIPTSETYRQGIQSAMDDIENGRELAYGGVLDEAIRLHNRTDLSPEEMGQLSVDIAYIRYSNCALTIKDDYHLMLNDQSFLKGFEDAQKDFQNPGVAKEKDGDLNKELQQQLLLLRNQMAEENKKVGENFLSANKSKKGIITLPDGLQYKIIMEGDGKKPSDTDEVGVSVSAKHLNGDMVKPYDDESRQTIVNQNIPGVREALLLMPEGSDWKLFVPPALAYGAEGLPSSHIGPNETLIFDVYLTSIRAQE